MRWLLAVGLALLAIGLIGHAPSARAASVASQCNGEMNQGGYEVACSVTIVQYLTASGALAAAPPSTLSLTRCVGAVDSVTCATVDTDLTEPIITVRQCDASGSGGGGKVLCFVSVTNHFVETVAALGAATVYQCVGSVISGPGAPGTCTPANTAGVTSVAEATVGQCNGSGNDGTNVEFICTVSPVSSISDTLNVNVDQCNGSGNGGGAFVECSAAVISDVTAPTTTPTPPTATPVPPTATPVPPTTTPVPPTTTPVPPTTTPAPPATTPAPTVAPFGSATPVVPVGVPVTPSVTPVFPGGATSTPSDTPMTPPPTPAVSTPPGSDSSGLGAPSPVTTSAPPQATPRPPATGNAALTAAGGESTPMMWLSILALVVGGTTILTMTHYARSQHKS